MKQKKRFAIVALVAILALLAGVLAPVFIVIFQK